MKKKIGHVVKPLHRKMQLHWKLHSSLQFTSQEMPLHWKCHLSLQPTTFKCYSCLRNKKCSLCVYVQRTYHKQKYSLWVFKTGGF